MAPLHSFAALSSSFIRSISQESISIRLSLRSKQGLILPSEVTRRRVQLAQNSVLSMGRTISISAPSKKYFFLRCISLVCTLSALFCNVCSIFSISPETRRPFRSRSSMSCKIRPLLRQNSISSGISSSFSLSTTTFSLIGWRPASRAASMPSITFCRSPSLHPVILL
jgi:hypothetical protein